MEQNLRSLWFVRDNSHYCFRRCKAHSGTQAMNINAMVKSLMGGSAVAADGIYLIAIAITSTEPSGTPTWSEINLGVAGSMVAGVLVGLV
jgi:hypothetical protein